MASTFAALAVFGLGIGGFEAYVRTSIDPRPAAAENTPAPEVDTTTLTNADVPGAPPAAAPVAVPALVPESSSITMPVAVLEAAPVHHASAPERAPIDKERRLADARRFAKTHSNDARALKAWATAAYRAGELREARRAADAWALHDRTAEPRLFLATTLDASGKRDEAQAVLEEWLQLHPDSADARALHARLGAPLATPESARRTQVAKRE